MYLINNENNIVLYDLEFNNRSEVIKFTKNLASDSIMVDENTTSSYEFTQMTKDGNNQSISNPVYIGEENKESNTVKVIKYTSKTPYTLALVSYYAKNNWLQSIYSSLGNNSIYLKKLVDRMTSGYLLFPQLYMAKCNFDGSTYQKQDRLFESLKRDEQALEFFLEEYCPDIKAFIELFPYMEFIEEKVYPEYVFESNSFEKKSAEYNMETLKQLGLTPNIRKK